MESIDSLTEFSGNNISTDTWVTVLFYLSDTFTDPVNPDQLIAVMKMSFVNKNLRNIITSNSFWVLYNSIEYESAKYNIYDCNENFCRIIYKIRSIDTGNILYGDHSIKSTDSGYISYGDHPKYDKCSIFGLICRFNYRMGRFNILNKEIVPTHQHFDKFLPGLELKAQAMYENEYCTLYEIYDRGNMTNFIIKKGDDLKHDNLNDSSDLSSEKDYLFSDIIHNDPKCGTSLLNYHNADAVLHDNYIWLTTKLRMDSFIKLTITNFYAQNVITNVKYLIHEIVERPCDFSNCSFIK